MYSSCGNCWIQRQRGCGRSLEVDRNPVAPHGSNGFTVPLLPRSSLIAISLTKIGSVVFRARREVADPHAASRLGNRAPVAWETRGRALIAVASDVVDNRAFFRAIDTRSDIWMSAVHATAACLLLGKLLLMRRIALAVL